MVIPMDPKRSAEMNIYLNLLKEFYFLYGDSSVFFVCCMDDEPQNGACHMGQHILRSLPFCL